MAKTTIPEIPVKVYTIMFRNSYEGGDGWQIYPLTVAVNDVCPECGGPRGDPIPYTFHEDGEWYTVDKWVNPCGHVDKYANVYREFKQRTQDITRHLKG